MSASLSAKLDARALDLLAWPVAVGHDRRQLLALPRTQNQTYLLCHGQCRTFYHHQESSE
jgi:hypothetical protein